MTDEEAAFMGIRWNFASHHTVKHTQDEYVRREIPVDGGPERIVTTNAVEGFFSILKRGVVRRLSACQRSALASLSERI
jgi:ISXO2-like transposase domain